MVLAGNDPIIVQCLKHHLDSTFWIKNLEHLKYFIGIEIAHSKEGIVLSQQKYTLDLLEEAGLLDAHPALFPMEQKHNMAAVIGDPVTDAGQYHCLIGRLLVGFKKTDRIPIK